MKRVVILALDALEYDLVEKFDLQNLKQEEYGKISLKGFKLINTSTIWASFITGLLPAKHQIHGVQEWESKFLEYLKNLSIKLHFDNIKGKGKLLEFFGFKRKYYEGNVISERGLTTIFDHVEQSIAIDVPTYSLMRDYELAKLQARTLGFFPDERTFFKDYKHENDLENLKFYEELKDYAFNKFEETSTKIITFLKQRNWQLLMGYTSLPDVLGHVIRGNLTEMLEIYLVLENFVSDVSSSVDDDTIILIVSDHGMKRFGKTGMYGEHSEHAFYSINKKVGIDKPHITDFFHIILRELGVKSA